MSNAALARRDRAVASARLRSRLLDHLALGASIEAIARLENLSQRTIQKLLREQFDRIEIRRLDEYAKLQIKRLDAMLAKLADGSAEPNVGAMALLLKVLDRMDRYHGVGRRAAVAAPPDDIARQRLLDKLNRMAARHSTPVLPPR